MPAERRAFLPGAWAENDRIRRFASANLVDAAMATGATRFIQGSFAPVYPDRSDQWIDERTPIAPVLIAQSRTPNGRRSASPAAGAPAWCCSSARCSMAPILVHPRPDRLRPARLGADPGRRRRLYLFGLARGRRRRGRRGAGCSRPAPTTWSMTSRCAAARALPNSLAGVLGVALPRLPPPWLKYLFGSLGEMLAAQPARPNRKLRDACGWAPRYPSMREGGPPVVAALR